MTLCPQPFNKLEITGILLILKSFARWPLTGCTGVAGGGGGMTGVVGLGSHIEIGYKKGVVPTVSRCPKVLVMHMASPLACKLGSIKLMLCF